MVVVVTLRCSGTGCSAYLRHMNAIVLSSAASEETCPARGFSSSPMTAAGSRVAETVKFKTEFHWLGEGQKV